MTIWGRATLSYCGEKILLRAISEKMRLTNWCVITGAPCSGKTSVVNELERRGYKVVHETARAYIDQQLAAGRRLDQIKADELAFENHILNAKLAIESSLPANETIFFDRGIPDSIAYFKLAGLNPARACKKRQPVSLSPNFLFRKTGIFSGPGSFGG